MSPQLLFEKLQFDLNLLFNCRLTGKANELEWIREGHRNYPLIARAPPYSALHILAEHASKAAAAENSTLPEPYDTRRSRTLDEEVPGKPIITEDPTLPPPSPSVFGISRKDLKKSFDSVAALHQSSKRKHYPLLKPPPPPNLRIQHLYQTLNTKRPRKSLTKKSSKMKKVSNSNSGRIHLPPPPTSSSSGDDKSFDSAELHRHLTSQLMPPPMSPSPMKSPTSQYQPILPATSKQRGNSQASMEPQAHYIPNNPSRLKSELLAGRSTSPSKKRVNKSVPNMQARNNFQQKYANGAGTRGMDNIPDPQIIFNTSSTSSSSMKLENEIHHHSMEHHNQHDLDLSSQASPLQLLSTAASCTPKLKINSSPQILQAHLHHSTVQQSSQHMNQPQLSSSPLPQTLSTAVKTNVQSRQIKIIPTNTKPVIIKPSDIVNKTSTQLQTNAQQQSKFKIQKIQLMMNKNQEGPNSTTSFSPTATIVSGKTGQFVFSGKGITNSYQVATKSPYAIVTTPKASVTSGSKVVTIQSTAAANVKDNKEPVQISNDNHIEFSTATNSSFPKVIIQKSPTTSTTAIPAQGKQIKLKLGTGIVNTKILHAPLTSFKIQRNVNTKGFTVINPSHIVQIQQPQSIQQQIIQQTSSQSSTPSSPQVIVASVSKSPVPTPSHSTRTANLISTPNVSTKVDWEQELDDVNRTKGGKSQSKSNGSGIAAKKLKKDDKKEVLVVEKVNDARKNQPENVIIETVDVMDEDADANSIVIYGEFFSYIGTLKLQIDFMYDSILLENPEVAVTTSTQKEQQDEIVNEFVFFKDETDLIVTKGQQSRPEDQIKLNGGAISTELNGDSDTDETDENVIRDRASQNGAEAYENLVKSLTDDYMKEMEEESIEENFNIMESNIIDFTSPSGLF